MYNISTQLHGSSIFTFIFYMYTQINFQTSLSLRFHCLINNLQKRHKKISHQQKKKSFLEDLLHIVLQFLLKFYLKVYNNNKRSTNCCAKWHLWQFFLFVLAYIEDSMGMMSLWCHSGRKKYVKLHHFLLVSVIYPNESHDFVIVLIDCDWSKRSHDQIQKPLQFSTKVSSSGGFIWLIQGNSLLFNKLFMCKRT